MALDYVKQPSDFHFFTLDEYIDLVIRFLEKLSPKIVVERFAGEVPPRYISGPNWGPIRYDRILQKIEKELSKRDTWQGKSYHLAP